jgi:hypothetical protein
MLTNVKRGSPVVVLATGVWVRVSYTLTFNDLLEAHSKHGGYGGKVLQAIGLLMMAGGLSDIRDPKASSVFLVVWGLFLTFFFRIQAWLRCRFDSRFQDEFEITISDSGIDISNPKVTSKFHWDSFVRYVETTTLFLIYETGYVFHIFPKRAFSVEQVDEFRRLLDQRLGAASIAYRKRIKPQTWAFLILITIVTSLLIITVLQATLPGE